MYKIIGGDGKEYGPVTRETLRKWLQEGRVDALTKVLPAGEANWVPLASLPGLADVFRARTPGIPPTIGAITPSLTAVQSDGVHDGDYELDIGGCVTRGYGVFKLNMGVLITSLLLAISPWIIGAVVRAFSIVPVVGIVFAIAGGLISLATLVIGGPLMGGMYLVFLKAQRGQTVVPMRDVLSGFSGRFGQLFLGYFIPVLITGLCMVPSVVVFLISLLPGIMNHQYELPVGAMAALGIALLLTLPVVIWLSINWLFTLPLIIDKGLDFWTAMKTSWRQVSRHWWTVFGLSLVVGLINAAGMLACFIGALFTAPIGISAFLQAYETLFTSRTPEPGQGA